MDVSDNEENYMKRIALIFLFAITVASQLFGQVDKIATKLSELYSDQKYNEVKKYKGKKINSLSSKSLYYKGMAYYMTEDDRNALKFLDLAITKGPIDHDMFYYKAMTLGYMDKLTESLPYFDQAINLLPDEPSFYASKGQVYYQLNELDSAYEYFHRALQLDSSNPNTLTSLGNITLELNRFSEGIEFLKTALEYLDSKTEEHMNCSFNIALGQQLAGKPIEAKTTLNKHIIIYPADYQAISKLIQIHYSLNEIEETSGLKVTLLEAYKSKSLPNHLKEMYCFDQFEWKDRKILAFESYEKYQNEILIWKHKFFIQDALEEIDFKIQTVLDTTNKSLPDQYLLSLIKDDTISTYSHYIYKDNSDYAELKNAVFEMLNEKVNPISQVGGFENWLNNQIEERIGLLGSSYDKAIDVQSVPEEYNWLRQNYPGYKTLQQSLVFEEGKPYDVLKITTSKGITKEVYFNISSFYGKDF